MTTATKPAVNAVNAALVAAALAFPASAQAGTVSHETHQGRSVRVFTPSTAAAKVPMVVMLHGCTQTADLFADATRIEDLAETEGFAVAFPEETDALGPNRCFVWYDPASQSRGAGEPKELADTIDELAAAHGVDLDRVYVAGISAGAAMSVVLGATYPDKVAGIGVVAGLEYRAATSLGGAIGAMRSGGPDPVGQGGAAFAAMGQAARVVPVFVVHGTSDGVVAKVNGDQVVTQWLTTDARVLGDGAIEAPSVEQVAAAAGGGYAFTRFLHRTKAEQAVVVEQLVVEGLGHAWPGGRDGGSFADPKGPDATKELWAFFQSRTRSAPLPPDPAAAAAAGAGNGAAGDGTSATAAGAAPPAPPDHGGCAFAPTGSAGAARLAAAIAGAGLVLLRRRRARPRSS